MPEEKPPKAPLTNEEVLTAAIPFWFTAEQKMALGKKFEEVLQQPNCELCGNEQWEIGTAPVSPIVLNLDRINRSQNQNLGFSYPSALLTCTKCGNSKMLQLLHLGFDPFSEPPA